MCRSCTLYSNGRACVVRVKIRGYWLGVRVGFRVRLGFGFGCAASCVLHVRQPASYPQRNSWRSGSIWSADA